MPNNVDLQTQIRRQNAEIDRLNRRISQLQQDLLTVSRTVLGPPRHQLSVTESRVLDVIIANPRRDAVFIGRVLGKDATVVNTHVHKIRKCGYDIQSTTKPRGYVYVPSPD